MLSGSWIDGLPYSVGRYPPASYPLTGDHDPFSGRPFRRRSLRNSVSPLVLGRINTPVRFILVDRVSYEGARKSTPCQADESACRVAADGLSRKGAQAGANGRTFLCIIPC